MAIKYEVTATVGTYKDAQGNEKKRYQRCGSVFENDKGHLSMKLDAIPTGNEWSGWFSFFEPKERESDRRQGPGRDVSAAEAMGKKPPPSDYDESDESSIPF